MGNRYHNAGKGRSKDSGAGKRAVCAFERCSDGEIHHIG